jgi:predicted Zn-dependent protease with MMP-like domain
MGFAQGTLLKQEITTMFGEFSKFLDEQVDDALPHVPEALRKLIEDIGIPAVLELTADLTKDFTPQHFFDEMQGLADGTGLEYKKILQLHMFPELIKASCSMLGAWGPATKNTGMPGELLQLRALDWGFDNPLTKYPLVAVYHPNEGDGEPFASLTFNGFVGTITAYGTHLGISEKVWLHYNGSDSRAGVPFTFLMRDVAQYDRTIDDAHNRMVNTHRTCSVFLGVGGRHLNQFRAIEYSLQQVVAFNDVNYPYYAETHPQLDGVVFIDKHSQPSTDPCMGSIMQDYYGRYNPAAIINLISLFQTGDLQAAIYDFGANDFIVSVAGPVSASNATLAPAYDRQFHRFHMTPLFAHHW